MSAGWAPLPLSQRERVAAERPDEGRALTGEGVSAQSSALPGEGAPPHPDGCRGLDLSPGERWEPAC